MCMDRKYSVREMKDLILACLHVANLVVEAPELREIQTILEENMLQPAAEQWEVGKDLSSNKTTAKATQDRNGLETILLIFWCGRVRIQTSLWQKL